MEKFRASINRRFLLKGLGVAAVGTAALAVVGCGDDGKHNVPQGVNTNADSYAYKVHVQVDGETGFDCFTNNKPEAIAGSDTIFTGTELYCPHGTHSEDEGRGRLGLGGREYFPTLEFSGFKFSIVPQAKY